MKIGRVGVLMGGPSCEREVSLRSGRAVCNALKNNKINVLPIELKSNIETDKYKEYVRQELKNYKVDVFFIALHGEFGEDGGVQSILEDMKLPYTGSDSEASRIGMDKIQSKDAFRKHNIPVPEDEILTRKEFLNCPDIGGYFSKLGGKLVVKPYDRGSSVGLSVVSSPEQFNKASESAFKYSDIILVERYVSGREITVGILDDRPLPIVEIVPEERVFDWQAKYENDTTRYIVPAEIESKSYKLCQQTAVKAHKAIGASSFSRVDIMFTEEKMPVVLEVNTIPGLTERSLLPKAAGSAGISFEKLCIKLLESAFMHYNC